uniref:Putative ovule protein n=1 Tax=Solanum chacoense TaxID=4108 RepID=A0A0V0IA84_SOLCH
MSLWCFCTKTCHQSSSEMLPVNQWVISVHPSKLVMSITLKVKRGQCKALFIRNPIDFEVLISLEHPALNVSSIKFRQIDWGWFVTTKRCMRIRREKKRKLWLWRKRGENGILNGSGVLVVEGLWRWHGGQRWNTGNRAFCWLLPDWLSCREES